jgi:hypothetical protein
LPAVVGWLGSLLSWLSFFCCQSAMPFVGNNFLQRLVGQGRHVQDKKIDLWWGNLPLIASFRLEGWWDMRFLVGPDTRRRETLPMDSRWEEYDHSCAWPGGFTIIPNWVPAIRESPAIKNPYNPQNSRYASLI